MNQNQINTGGSVAYPTQVGGTNPTHFNDRVTDAPQRHITQQFQELEAAAEGLMKAWSNHASRIAPIVASYPAPPTGKAEPISNLVPVAERMRQITNSIKSVLVEISQTTNQVEL